MLNRSWICCWVFLCTSFGLCVGHLLEPSGKWSNAVLAPADVHPSSSDSRRRLHPQGWNHICASHHTHLSPDPHPGDLSWHMAETLGRCTSGWRRVWACQSEVGTLQQRQDVWHCPDADLRCTSLYPGYDFLSHGWWCNRRSRHLLGSLSVWTSLWELTECHPHSATCTGPRRSEVP